MKKNKHADGGLVYSTDSGRMCPQCAQPIAVCVCAQKLQIPTGDGTVRISRSTRRRNGKSVSVVSGLNLPPEELQQVGRELRQLCGTGGTVKDGCIEIQGDQREALLSELLRRGFKAKIAGG